jgi:TRAP-type mannitol/chloroaromatic compound transport system permease large subunit
MAEDLLETVGQVFGPLRGGLAVAVILVGALLAATTGVVAAAVISMGLISLPIMLRYGYNRTIATGTITASRHAGAGHSAFAGADRAGRPAGPLGGRHVRRRHAAGPAAGGLLPAVRGRGGRRQAEAWVPALPAEARIYREDNGSSGHRSLLVLFIVCGAAGYVWSQVHERMINGLTGRVTPAPGDETFIMSLTVATILALVLALVNKFLKLGLLSKLAQQVTFVLIPPLILIFLVLGTIFLGVATPTEGGAMGAVGALIMAGGRRQLSMKLMKQAWTARPSWRPLCCSS